MSTESSFHSSIPDRGSIPARSAAWWWRVLPALVVLLACAVDPAAAQETEPPHGRDIHGTVVAADDGSPLPGTFVRLVELGLGELTHQDGSFHVERVPPGDYTLQVERLGYRSVERPVTVPEEGVEVRIELQPSALAMDPITVTAAARARSAGESLRPVNVLSEAELLRQLEGTVAGSIQEEAGVAMSSLGPATQNPVIRGLSGDRVLMLEDGERVGDLSASSADHASATDPLSARRIEVVRGPSALLYGSNALGGVVNVIREEVPRRMPDRVTGRATVEAASVNESAAIGATATAPLGSRFALRAEGNGRMAGDLSTPAGDLENTDQEVANLSGGVSWVEGGSGYAGASYRFYRNHYGIPGGFEGGHEEGVRIRMRRHQMKAKAEWLEEIGPISRVELSGTFTDYGHRELESDGSLGTAFDRTAMTGEIQAHHDDLGPFTSGAAGVRWQWDDHRFGGFLDTEDTRRDGLGLYLLEELNLDPVTVEAGARYDWGRTTPRREIADSEIGHIRQRSFGAVSGSFGLLLDVADVLDLGGSVSRAFRVPDVGELYSEGPHLAAYSFEVGNPDLEEEVGTGLDLFARIRTADLRGELAVFQNVFDGYVFPRNTGEVSRVQLPIYQFAGEDALLRGMELSVEWGITESLVTDVSGSYVRGTLTDTDEPIPFMPPLKGDAHLRYDAQSWFLEGGLRAAGRQDRVGEFETPTDGYAVLNASAGLRLELGGRLHTLTLRGANLTDREYRNHLSRTKEIMPEAGRGASLLYRVSF